MAAVNQVCATILDNVINSGLDFSINQTPYSIHFSLRKKYSKNPSNKVPLNSPPQNTSLPQETLDNFHQELLYTRNEYVKLYNMYEVEREARCNLDKEYKKLIANLANEETNVKAIKTEKKSLKEKLESKCLEFRNLKTDLENVKKDTNVLSVALKASKSEIKEQRKEFEKKKSELEKNVVELNDFKKNKLAEERELKIKNRKEIKKAKQKLKKEKDKESSTEENLNEKDYNLNTVETTTLKTKVPSECEEKSDLNLNISFDGKPELNEEIAFSLEETEQKLMSEEEKEAFFKEIFAKVDKDLKTMWPPWGEK